MWHSMATCMRELAAQFLALAEKQGATAPLMIAHRIMGISLHVREISRKAARISIRRSRFTILPSIVRWRRVLAIDVGVAILSYRSWALWFLGYPEAALADADQAISDAREIGQAATLMYALGHTSFTYLPVRKLRDSKGGSR